MDDTATYTSDDDDDDDDDDGMCATYTYTYTHPLDDDADVDDDTGTVRRGSPNEDAVDAEMGAAVAAVSERLAVSLDVASTLLTEFKWSALKLYGAWFGAGHDRVDALLTNAQWLNCERSGEGSTAETVPCAVCLADVDTAAMVVLTKCRHQCCERCWADHVRSEVGLGNTAPACVECPCRLPDSFIAQVSCRATTERLHALRRRVFLLHAFDTGTPCPQPSCGKMVRHSDDADFATCGACNHEFCVKCTRPCHAPVSCAALDAWDGHCASVIAAGTAAWELDNVKACPSCGTRIFRDGGCNHMSCACGFHFCWMCVGPWSTHDTATGGFYKCNLYKPRENRDGDAAAVATMERLDHFLSRVNNSKRAARLAASGVLGEVAIVDVVEWLEARTTGSTTNRAPRAVITSALVEVERSRTVLAYTYVAAFLMAADAPETGLFSHLQTLLEEHADHLQELCERNAVAMMRAGAEYVSVVAIAEFLEEVHTFTTAARGFRQRMCTSIMDGLGCTSGSSSRAASASGA